MKELNDIAAQYAANNADRFLTQLIAQSFADGYRQGYKDREDEIPVSLRDGNTEFVDLGLPSGTLWSADYEKIDGKTIYQTYENAEAMSIPTNEQCKELLELCDWESEISSGSMRQLKKIICIGPNGNLIHFQVKGFITSDKIVYEWSDSVFWIKTDNPNGSERNAVILNNRDEKGLRCRKFSKNIVEAFMGYKLPIRLVKSK